MKPRQKEELVDLAGKRISFDRPMAQHTTLRVGGSCEALYKTDNTEELQQVVRYLVREGIPYFSVGRGSNLLITDEGLSGLVIILTGPLAAIREERRHESILLAGAGLALADLISHCRCSGLGGLECYAGIPGTVGGAVAMNAGAYGEAFGARVLDVRLITPKGRLEIRGRAQLKFTYRNFEMEKGSVIVSTRLKLNLESKEMVAQRIADHLKKRKQSQPLEYPSAGSVFKNPPDKYAGRLIEDAGLKGRSIGGAMISEKHANFIINTGGASAKDILDLLNLARSEVKKQTGIELEPEIKVLGR